MTMKSCRAWASFIILPSLTRWNNEAQHLPIINHTDSCETRLILLNFFRDWPYVLLTRYRERPYSGWLRQHFLSAQQAGSRRQSSSVLISASAARCDPKSTFPRAEATRHYKQNPVVDLDLIIVSALTSSILEPRSPQTPVISRGLARPGDNNNRALRLVAHHVRGVRYYMCTLNPL